MDFRGLVWKRVWKTTFFRLKWAQGLENRAVHPHQEFLGVPPPPPAAVSDTNLPINTPYSIEQRSATRLHFTWYLISFLHKVRREMMPEVDSSWKFGHAPSDKDCWHFELDVLSVSVNTGEERGQPEGAERIAELSLGFSQRDLHSLEVVKSKACAGSVVEIDCNV